MLRGGVEKEREGESRLMASSCNSHVLPSTELRSLGGFKLDHLRVVLKENQCSEGVRGLSTTLLAWWIAFKCSDSWFTGPCLHSDCRPHNC